MTRQMLTVISAFCLIAAIGIGLFNLNEAAQIRAEIDSLQSTVHGLAQSQASASEKLVATPKTQDQLLTSAVAKSASAVVSIVVSKYAPQLQVQYVNPFGNDPLFKDFGLQVPVYRQQGSSLHKVGAGSGFIISHDGYILTNKHVVEDPEAEYTVLLSSGVQKTASVTYRDPSRDVAILKISGTYPTIASIGDSTDVKLGQTVVAIGNALGEYGNSVSVGIISGLNRTVEASDENGNTEQLNGVIQTDASINLGNSGGPLIDLAGDVVGINVATVIGSNNINFSIPINAVKVVIKPYI